MTKNGGKKANLTRNKSTIYAWTCLFNCASHANDVGLIT